MNTKSSQGSSAGSVFASIESIKNPEEAKVEEDKIVENKNASIEAVMKKYGIKNSVEASKKLIEVK